MAAPANTQSLSFDFFQGNLVIKDSLVDYGSMDASKYVCVDYVVRKDEVTNQIIYDDLIDWYDIEKTRMTLLYDGVQKFHRVVVPKLEKDVDLQQNRIFYYEGGFYYALEDLTYNEIDFDTNLKSVPLGALYTELVDWLGTNGEIYKQYEIFSYELLKRAFVEVQNKFMHDRDLWDLVSYKIKKAGRYERDIILCTLLAVRELLAQGRLEDADIFISTLEKCPNVLGRKDSPKDCQCELKVGFFIS